MIVNKTVPCLVMIRRLGPSSQYIHILGLGRLSPILFLPCKALHGLDRGLDILLTTTGYAGSDAKDEDGHGCKRLEPPACLFRKLAKTITGGFTPAPR